MSGLMQRRETDANARMIDLMTTMKDLTLGVRAMAAQTATTQAKVTPVASMTSNSDGYASTSAAPNPTQTAYRKVAQSNAEQAKPLKLIPPATYKRDLPRTNKMARVITESRDVGTDPLTSISLDPFARGASTTGDYYSPASGMTTRESNYHTARTNVSEDSPKQAYLDLIPRPVATSTQRKSTTKRNLEQHNDEMEQSSESPNATPDTPRTSQRQALAEVISTAMSKGLEPLLAAKESKNKPTKYRGTKDGNTDGWMMLMKRHLEKAHTRATPLDKAWTIIEYLEHEARDYITNKSEAERDTDEKVFALLARRFGTGSSKIHIQQQFRTRNQSNEEDYMQYLDALEGLRSQGYPNEEVTVRRYEITQKFIESVRNFELKRNLALMYAQEQYVEAPPTVEALRFTVQQYLRMRGSNRSDNYQMAQPQHPQPQHPQPQQPNQQPKLPQAIPPPIPQPQQIPPPQQPAPYRPQPQRACFNCGDPSHFVIDCPLNDRARKPVQQQVNSCHTNPSGGWTCPSQPHGVNNEVYPASLPIQGTVAFCVKCGCAEHSASECISPEYPRQEEQIRAAWYAPHTNQFDGAPQNDQVRVISVAEAGGPSRPVVITCGEKQVLTTLEAPAPDCTETLISIHLLLSAEQKTRPELTLAQLKEELCRNAKYTIAARPLPHFTREDETKLADHLGVEDFLLGRNFLPTYNVLVDLTAMRVTIRDPKTPRHFKPIHDVSDHEPSLVVSTDKVVLGPFERKLVRAQVITQDPNDYRFRNVMIRPSGVYNRSSFVSEDTLTSVGDDGTIYLAVRNKTAIENLQIPSRTFLGKAEPTVFKFRPIPVDQTDRTSMPLIEQVNNINIVDLDDTSSEFSSFAQNFLSSTELSEEDMSESEKRAQTDPNLLKPIPRPN